ncbi:MAG TPA: DUF454 domain-containing protein [Spirochaetaceae bacterium]|jgi:uncharacterized membrane protein YbaN (DUF454 family)|nr:DUF454 domain-containing protein [Spirochaetaceae bacterium]
MADVQLIGLKEDASVAGLGKAADAAKARLRRAVLIAAGTVCVALGALGALLPVLPTTPFLLLAAACYIRSSKRLYAWLIGNRFFGEYLRRYRAGEGLPLGFKLWTLALLWLSLGSSAFFALPERLWWLRLLLLIVGLAVSAHILHIKTYRR